MPALENTFSWSKSRDEEFRECRRRYYYGRYLCWGGWDKSAPQRVRLAYIFKNLKNRWAWKGETVHHLIEDALKDLRYGKPVNPAEIVKRLTELMRSQYRQSKAKRYFDDPKNLPGLFEHEYDKPVTDDGWRRIHDEAAACLKNFFASGFYRELEADDKKTWLLIEDLEEFAFDGAKVYVKLDLARKHGSGVEIYDWKTGKNGTEGAEVQLGAYALYAMQKWNLPLEGVRTFLMGLSQTQAPLVEQFLTPQVIERTQAAMTESIAAMRSFMTDPVKNVPKPEEEFAFTANDKLCDFCAFRKICAKYG